VNRGLTAEIDLGAAARNLATVRRAAGGRPVIAVVKADAYGHGAVEISRALERAGAHALAVAFVSEARELREAGIKLPVLVLFDRSEAGAYFAMGLTPVLHDLKTARAFSEEAQKRNAPIGVHLKLDTGMGRMGFGSKEEMAQAVGLPGLEVKGFMSHFSEADLGDMEFMRYQLGEFSAARDMLIGRGLSPLCHMANSAALFAFPESHMDAVRPGLVLYGCMPFEGGVRADAPALKPLMKVKAGVLALRRLPAGRAVSYSRTFITRRETVAAVLAAGYADAFPRLASNRAHVLINGRRAPVMGRVCMDLMAVDATDVGDVEEGAEAVLLGEDGGGEIAAWELARDASTVPYEVFTSLGARAKRVYKGAGG
jgi:alanine racemase